MNIVAENLVATLMQNSFNSNKQLPNLKGLNHSNFSSILKQSYNKSNNEVTYYKDIQSKKDFALKEPSIDSIKERFDKKLTQSNPKDPINEVSKKEEKVVDRETPKTTKTSEEKPKTTERLESKESKDTSKITEKKVDDVDQDVDSEVTKITDQQEIQLIEDVAKSLDISVEELTNILNQLGINVINLVNPSDFKKVMEKVFDISSSTDLLVHENALEKLQNVAQVLKDQVNNLKQPDLIGNTLNSLEDQVPTKEEKSLVSQFLNQLQSTTTGNDAQSTSQSGLSDNSMGTANSSSLANKNSSITVTAGSAFEGILNHVITQKIETIVMNGAVATITKEVTAKDVLDQIVTGMKVQVSEGKSTVVLQLNPENLGKIALSLTHENGGVTGHFVAESEAVKKVIESNLAQLKNQLQNQGIQVNELKIVVGDSTAFFAGNKEKDGNNNQNESKRSRRIQSIINDSKNFADTLGVDDLNESNNIVHENSSIELKA